MNCLNKTIDHIKRENGRAFIVGGAVRDLLLNPDITPKDIDVEVFNIPAETLQNILQEHFGDVKLVGESFGVFKVKDEAGTEFDFSLPRRESKNGSGHKGFLIESDPNMTPEEAASRRDFTINSMMMEFTLFHSPLIHDFFGGRDDLKNQILRHTSNRFSEDPLRVLRAMQFAGRFNMILDDDTARLCKELKSEFPTLAKERIWEEWKKWATKSERPSMGLLALIKSGWIDLFPFLPQLIDLPQNPNHHPEGDVMQHTIHAVDAAAFISMRDGLSKDETLIQVFAALCHDFGKIETTFMQLDGSITSYSHDKVGKDMAFQFMKFIGATDAIANTVATLVSEHMVHVNSKPMSHRVVRRLANRMHPHATIAQLDILIQVDHAARPPKPADHPCPELMKIAEEISVTDDRPVPFITGKNLLELGFTPGKIIGQILAEVFDLQLNGDINSTEEALVWVKENRMDN